MILQIKFTGKDKYTNLKYIHILYLLLLHNMEKQTTNPERSSSTGEPFSVPPYGANLYKPTMKPEEKAMLEKFLREDSPESVNPNDFIPLTIEFIDGMFEVLDVFIDASKEVVRESSTFFAMKLHPDTPSEYEEGFKNIVKETFTHNMGIYQIGMITKYLATELKNNLQSGRGFQDMSLIMILFTVLGSSVAQAMQTCETIDPSQEFSNLTNVLASHACQLENRHSVVMEFSREYFGNDMFVFDTGDPNQDLKLKTAQLSFEDKILRAWKNPDRVKELVQSRFDVINTESTRLVTDSVPFINEFLQIKLDCIPTSKAIKDEAQQTAVAAQLQKAYDKNMTTSIENMAGESSTEIATCEMAKQYAFNSYSDALHEMFSLTITVEECTLINNKMSCTVIIQGGMMNSQNIVVMFKNMIEKLESDTGIKGIKEAMKNPSLMVSILAEYAKKNKASFMTNQRFAVEAPIWTTNLLDRLMQVSRSTSQMPQLYRTLANSKLKFALKPNFLRIFVDEHQSALFPYVLRMSLGNKVFLPSVTDKFLNMQELTRQLNLLNDGPSAITTFTEGVSTGLVTFTGALAGTEFGKEVEETLKLSALAAIGIVKTGIVTLNNSGTGAILRSGESIDKSVNSAATMYGQWWDAAVMVNPLLIICAILITCGSTFLTARFFYNRLMNQHIKSSAHTKNVRITEEANTEILKLEQAARISETRARLSAADNPPQITGTSSALTTVTSSTVPKEPYNGSVLQNYMFNNLGINKPSNFYSRNSDGTKSGVPTLLKLSQSGKVLRKKTAQKNSPFIEVGDEFYFIGNDEGIDGGTRKHKKRIGAASKHHKKRRRGTKKPSKRRRATRRKRR